MSTNSRLFSTKQAAELLRCTTASITRLANRYGIGGKPNGRYLFVEEDVKALSAKFNLGHKFGPGNQCWKNRKRERAKEQTV